MIALKRPQKSEAYLQDDNLKQNALKVAAANGALKIPDGWGDYKEDFKRAQHCKCGWCEVKDISGYGAIDHFAPKGRLEYRIRIPVEKPGLNTVAEGEYGEISKTGYWWLAYVWENWLYSCSTCNTGWKRCLFPIAGDNQHPSNDFMPLLLNPFEDPDPEGHVMVGEEGEIRQINGSHRGVVTIDTCGLDRPSLRRERKRVYTHVLFLCDKLYEAEKAIGRGPQTSGFEEGCRQFSEIINFIYASANDEAEFSNAARSAIQCRQGLTWKQFVAEYPQNVEFT